MKHTEKGTEKKVDENGLSTELCEALVNAVTPFLR